jgi:hypothetical protein
LHLNNHIMHHFNLSNHKRRLFNKHAHCIYHKFELVQNSVTISPIKAQL